jgi:hypothetical protein
VSSEHPLGFCSDALNGDAHGGQIFERKYFPMTKKEDSILSAVSCQNQKQLLDSFAGTQFTLGLLLRLVAEELIEKKEELGASPIDALGVVGRSCEILDTAFDEVHDRQIQGLIRNELMKSLAVAVGIKEKLSYRDFAETSKPLQWVYVFTLRLSESLSKSDHKYHESMQKSILILVDFLINESDKLGETQNITSEQDDIKREQILALQALRDRIVNI